MQFDEVVRRRRMCRSFTSEAVAPELIDRLLDWGRRSPSAGHTQGWSFLVLTGEAETGRFWSVASDSSWRASADDGAVDLIRAPVIIVPWCSSAAYLARYSEPDKAAFGLGVSEDRWPAPFWVTDVSFATMVLLLGATEVGLGALFFGLRGAGEEGLRAEFGVPGEWSAIGAVALGWPSDGGSDRASSTAGSAWRGRRAWDEVVHRGRW